MTSNAGLLINLLILYPASLVVIVRINRSPNEMYSKVKPIVLIKNDCSGSIKGVNDTNNKMIKGKYLPSLFENFIKYSLLK